MIGVAGLFYALVGLYSPPPIHPDAVKAQQDKERLAKQQRESAEQKGSASRP